MAGESRLQTQVIKHLKTKQIWHVKTKECNRSGIPDIIICKDGNFAAIELKSPLNHNDASDLQKYELRKIRASGGRTLVSRSLSECITFIEGL